MYVIFLIVIAAFYTVFAILNDRDIKKIKESNGELKIGLSDILKALAAHLAAIILCLIGGISFASLGFRPIAFQYNRWFTIIVLVLNVGFFILQISQVITLRKNAKSREAAESQSETNATMISMFPRTKREKNLWFWLSLNAGIGEETVFRGIFFFLIMAIFPNISIVLVILIVTLLFGILHLYQGLQGIIQTALIGALYGCLYLVTGSLIPGMILHFLTDYSAAFMFPVKRNAEFFQFYHCSTKFYCCFTYQNDIIDS
jgi:membrane protease YdiL (CAAX protease family)